MSFECSSDRVQFVRVSRHVSDCVLNIQTVKLVRLTAGGTCCPDVLRYVTMNITTNELCDGVYALANITADMICASDNTGMTERDSCQVALTIIV